MQRQLLLQLPAGRLVGGEPLPLLLQVLPGGVDLRVEFSLPLRLVRHGASGGIRGTFELLEANQAREVFMHGFVVGPPGFEPGTGRL